MRTRIFRLMSAAAGLITLGITWTAAAAPRGDTRAFGGVQPRSSPPCSAATAKAPLLNRVRTAFTRVPGGPFGVAVTRNGASDLIALGPFVGVLHNAKSGPTMIRRVRLSAGSSGRGEALTPDGRHLLIANLQSGADVVSVNRAVRRRPGALLGTLSGGAPLKGAFEVAITADSRFAFVTLASRASVAIFDLHKALTSGFGPADFLGTIPVGFRPVGIAISPDNRWLYVTSEHVAAGVGVGTLSVISVSTALSDPGHAVVATVRAGCDPVRVVASADGRTVWVAARASNAIIGFSAARLVSHPAHALLTWVRVGSEPIGLAMVHHGARIVVADSNRFPARGAKPSLAVVSVPAALAGRRALLGYLPAGRDPREMAIVPSRSELLVSNYGSRQLESVGLAGLP
jgi:DNA-binding beta-propeller fold protein YncE